MGILGAGLKRRGHISVGYNIFQTYLGYQDHIINTTPLELTNTSKQMMSFFDIFHFHYNSSILQNFADLPLIKAKGKKMFMHHWGNDVRFHDKARINNPYVYTGDSPPNSVIHEKLLTASKYIREAIVQDHEVLPYVVPYYEKVHVLPIAIDLAQFTPAFPSPANPRPLILHAPTNPAFKGTAPIEQAIEKLKERYDFRYRRVQQLNHLQAVQLYREADIIIDQILCGSYGLLSVEAMAFGKPVLTYVRDDLVPLFPAELPIINTNPDTIHEKIKELLENPELRYQAGVRGRIYAEKYHARDVVVDKLLSIYSS